MTYNRLPTQRTCLHCAEPLNGRADKKFCDSSCKAHHHRAASGSTTTLGLPSLSLSDALLAQALAAYSPYQVLNYFFQDFDCPAYVNYAERYERVCKSQLAGDPLHGEYASIMVQFFCCQFDDITNVGYGNAVEELTEAVNAYLQHPGLLIPGHIAHHRLADLYMLYSLFQALHKAALTFHAQGSHPPGEEAEMPRNYDYVSERQLQHMWANLLGVR